MKNILVVCRYNQARSILIGALLRKLFPELSVVTAGIEATDGLAIPVSSAEICMRWQLPNFDRHSKSVDALNENSDWDAVLAADQLVYDRLQNSQFASKVDLLESYSNSSDFIPIDPTNLRLEDFALELSKAALLGLKWIESVLKLPQSNINGYILDSNKYLDILDTTNDFYENSPVLIDMQMKVPNFEFWKKTGIQVVPLNPRNLDSQIEKIRINTDPIVLVSQFEIDFPEYVFTSQKWREFLLNIASHKEVKLLSIIEKPHGSSLSTSYLSLLNCGKLHFLA